MRENEAFRVSGWDSPGSFSHWTFWWPFAFLSHQRYPEPPSPSSCMLTDDRSLQWQPACLIREHVFSLAFRALCDIPAQYNSSHAPIPFSTLQPNPLISIFFLKLCHIFSPLCLCSCCSPFLSAKILSIFKTHPNTFSFGCDTSFSELCS